ncbi:MAG TPA: hypothetical protein VF789_31240 [Thermoanaerobaculia bacterium]
MKRSFSSTTAFAFVLVLTLAAGAAGLDHFQVYTVQQVDVSFAVRLTDQFDPAAKKGQVVAITHFSNATRKVHGSTQVGIKDTNAHLTWYTLKQAQAEPRRTVRFRNQFGQHSVDIRDPRFLLVPTHKTSHAGSQFPKNLDHYKCYEVITVNTAPTLPVVKLGDQFGSRTGQVGKPLFFCTPVRKQRSDEKPPELFDAKTHLAIYALPAMPRAVSIKTRDQFGPRQLNVLRSVMLAVPTEKQVFVPHPN